MDLPINIDREMLEALQVRANEVGQDVNEFVADLLATHDDKDDLAHDDLVFYGRLLESVGQAVIATDLRGMVIHWDGAAQTLYGWDANEAIGRQLSTLIGFKLSEEDNQERLATLRSGTDWLREHYVTHRAGRRFPALFTDHAITNANDKVIGIISVSTDISNLKTLQIDLQRNETRLRSILDSQTAYIVRISLADRTYSYVNAIFDNDFSWLSDTGTMVGMRDTTGIHPEDIPEMELAGKTCLENPGVVVPLILRKKAKDGSYFWTQWEFMGLLNEDGKVHEFQCIGLDITREKDIERALLETEELYRLIATHSRDAISLHAPDGSYLYMNPYSEQLFGYTTGELMLLSAEEREALIHPDDIERTRDEAHEQTLTGESVTRITYRLRCKSGRYVWVESATVPIMNDDGEVERILSTTRNITERKQAEAITLENERLRTQFQAEQNRNKLIHDIMSTFNHDVRTSLAIIMTSRDSLKRYYDLLTKDQREKKLETIGRHVQVATSLLDDVVLLRNESDVVSNRYNPQRVNLATLCRVSVDEMQTNTDKHTLSFVHETDRAEFVVDEILISRILLNLLSNAIKYSPEGGHIQLALSIEDSEVVLRLADEGSGIPDNKQVSIFDTNFRLPAHESIAGTGLGLSIVRDCVQLHDGTIAVESELGVGSTFIIRLPIRE